MLFLSTCFPLATAITVLSAVALSYANPTCAFVEHPGKALSSKYSTSIDSAKTLQACLDTLYQNGHEAVAFNQATHECCGIPNSISYEFVENSQWTAYTLSSAPPVTTATTQADGSASTATTKPATTPATATTTQAHSTAASTPAKETTTEGIAPTAPNSAGGAPLINSTKVGGITIAHYCNTNLNKHYYWRDAVAHCESIGWVPAQLHSDRLFTALQNFANNPLVPTDCQGSWIGASYNEESGVYEWTETGTPVHSYFFLDGQPEEPYVPYPYVMSDVFFDSVYHFHNWYYDSALYSFLCSSE